MQQYASLRLETRLKFYGEGALMLGHDGVICSDRNTADAVPHEVMLRNVTMIRFSRDGVVLEQNMAGENKQLAQIQGSQGLAQGEITLNAICERGNLQIWIDGAVLYQGPGTISGLTGLWAGAGSYVDALSYQISGEAQAAQVTALSFEGLLGSAAFPNTFIQANSPEFRFGMGHVLTSTGSRAKWNYFGQGAELWAPQGPQYGKARLWVDGANCGVLDFSAKQEQASATVYRADLSDGYHAVTLECITGQVPVDCLSYLR
jgi:hypothetical protein